MEGERKVNDGGPLGDVARATLRGAPVAVIALPRNPRSPNRLEDMAATKGFSASKRFLEFITEINITSLRYFLYIQSLLFLKDTCSKFNFQGGSFSFKKLVIFSI